MRTGVGTGSDLLQFEPCEIWMLLVQQYFGLWPAARDGRAVDLRVQAAWGYGEPGYSPGVGSMVRNGTHPSRPAALRTHAQPLGPSCLIRVSCSPAAVASSVVS